MTSEHARRCGGSLTSRHHALNHSFDNGVKRDSRVPLTHRETNGCFLNSHRTLRMDRVIGGQQMKMPGTGGDIHKAAAIDFAITDPGSASYVNQAAQVAGSAAATVARGKHRHYSVAIDTAEHTFFPLVFELHGAACKEAHTLVKALAAQQVVASGGSWSMSQAVSRWRRRLSLAVQREVSKGVHH